MFKLLLTFSLIFQINLIANAQTANLSGVVTYYFNEYQGDKADLGAKVYLIPFDQESKKLGILDTFLRAKILISSISTEKELVSLYQKSSDRYKNKKSQQEKYEEYSSKLAEAKEGLKEIEEKLGKIDLNTKEKFDEYDKRVYRVLLDNLNRKDIGESVVDGSGNYSFSAKPGTYFVIIISKGRRGLNVTEVGGKVYLKKVELLTENTKNVSYNFNLD